MKRSTLNLELALRQQVYIVAIVLGIASVGGGIMVWRGLPSPRPDADLKRAMKEAPDRFTEGRLSGFPYAPHRIDRQSHAAKTFDEPPFRVQLAASKATTAFAGRQDGTSFHLVGVAHILTGDSESGIAALEKAIERNPADARTWNDLAVARQHAASRNSMDWLLADALGAAGRALAEDPDLPEARFNQALVWEKIGLFAAAVRAYQSYIEIDTESPWMEEARARLRQLERPTLSQEWARDRPLLERAALARDLNVVRRIVAVHRQEARTWCETIYLANWAEALRRHDVETAANHMAVVAVIAQELMQVNGDTFVTDAFTAAKTVTDLSQRRLASGYQRYYAARVLYRDRNIKDALPGFIAAEQDFIAARSPMRFVAKYYRAMACDDSGRTAEAMVMLDELLLAVGAGHHALRAQVLWAQATAHTRQGLLHAALAKQKESLAIFAQLGEEKNTCAMMTNVAATLAAVGRRTEAWHLRLSTFARLSRLGDQRELQNALEVAARTEAAEERWEVALPLLAEAAHAAIQPNPIVHASIVLWHALAEQRLGRTSTGDHLSTAERVAEAIPAGAARERARLDVKLVAAVGVLRTDPRLALRLLHDYIDGADTHAHRLFLPEAHLLRARAWRALGDDRRAEVELRATLSQLSIRDSDPLEQRSTYFRTGDEATRELVDILVRRSDAGQAFAVLAEFRDRPYVQFTAPNNPAPQRDVVIVEYLVLRDRLLVFTATSTGVTVTVVNATEMELRKTTDRFVESIRGGTALPKQTALWRWLVAPVLESVPTLRLLIIVPDPIFGRLPFAALRDPAGRHLIEYMELAVAPASSLASSCPARERKRIVAVGDPLVDRSVFDLPPLHHAIQEAQTVAGRYPQFDLFTGAKATRAAILAAASNADVLHFAAHAVVVPRDPSASYLALAPSDTENGALTLRDIQRATLHSKPLIVLAGCKTGAAVGLVPRATSLAQAFLSAGATDVVGTLWDLPDTRAAREMSVRFHEEIRRGVDPPEALRAVQLEMIRSKEPNRRDPLIWSSFQLYVAHNACMAR